MSALSIAPSSRYPASLLFTDLKATLPTLFERSSTSFRRATANKLDERGNVREINVLDPATGEKHRGSEITYIEEVRSGDLYLNESESVVAIKCTALAIATPWYIVGAMLWHLDQTCRAIIQIAKRTFTMARPKIDLGRYFGAAQIIQRETRLFRDIFKYRMGELLSAPFFGLGMFMSALIGVVKPLHGRRLFAMFDKALHRGISYKEDMRNMPEISVQRQREPFKSMRSCGNVFFNCKKWWQDTKDDCADCGKIIYAGKEFYLGYCFQVRGNSRDSRIKVLERAPLQPYFG